MSQADYDAMYALFSIITGDALKKPNMPVLIVLQEAENLLDAVNRDREALLGAGLDEALLGTLHARIGALRIAEANWFRDQDKREEAHQRWDAEAPAAYALRDQLVRAMRYAYRNNEATYAKVVAIAEGSGHADMIQDLVQLAVLGRDDMESLRAIKLDLALLDKAADLSDEMANLLAKVTGDRAGENSVRVLRDQAFTLLKQAVDEVRACAQYVFWDDAKHLEQYSSKHLRMMRAAARKKAGADSITPESV